MVSPKEVKEYSLQDWIEEHSTPEERERWKRWSENTRIWAYFTWFPVLIIICALFYWYLDTRIPADILWYELSDKLYNSPMQPIQITDYSMMQTLAKAFHRSLLNMHLFALATYILCEFCTYLTQFFPSLERIKNISVSLRDTSMLFCILVYIYYAWGL